MTRIHPRDQSAFSAFIDQWGEQGESAKRIEYRFSTSRQGEWIRVRQTAGFLGGGEHSGVGSFTCLIEELPTHGAVTWLEILEEQLRGEAIAGEKAPTQIFPGFVSAEAFEIPSPNQNTATSRIRDAVTTALSERRALEEKGLKGSTILLVEDEAGVRKLVRKLLEMLGCNVIEASSGRKAMEIWPEIRDQISLVVSDIVMPGGISGWDLAKELHHRHPALPILLTSGYSEFAEDHDLINHPRIAFLQKPYQIKSLRNTLCRLTRETVPCCQK